MHVMIWFLPAKSQHSIFSFPWWGTIDGTILSSVAVPSHTVGGLALLSRIAKYFVISDLRSGMKETRATGGLDNERRKRRAPFAAVLDDQSASAARRWRDGAGGYATNVGRIPRPVKPPECGRSGGGGASGG